MSVNAAIHAAYSELRVIRCDLRVDLAVAGSISERCTFSVISFSGITSGF